MHVLQTTLLPAPGTPSGLYLRATISGTAGALRAATGGEGLNITLDAGDSLSTDTYFGSFYLSHWQALTDIDHLAVVVGFAGHGKVRVLEVGPSGTELLCEYKLRSAGVQRHLIAFRRGGLDAILADGQTAGRLYVEVVAITACQVQSIDFVTETAPRQDVRLSIGMSTFNDTASQIGTVLPEVMMVAAQSEAIRAVYLVNHGAELSRVGATLQQAKLHHLAPAAEDAPGGLAQTIAAARAAGDGGTHHLVLADDQLVDARLILRVVEFLRHAKGPLILGAPALDARRPTALLAAAVVVGEAGQFRYAGQGKDLIGRPANTARRIDPLAPFAKVAQTDYCPWWFCVLPLDTATALPQRGYARGDDFAYEQEEHSKGVQSLTLPGMGVWRMPSLTVPDSNDLTNRYLPLRRLPAEGEATPPRQLHLLQGTMFPAEDLPEIMYLRVTPERRRGGLVPRKGQCGRPVICLDTTSFLSTDTFFGSFYRAYWHEYTKVRDLSLVVELSGAARVRVFEDAGRGIVLLNEERVESVTPQRFLIDFRPSDLRLLQGETDPRPSRLFVEVEAETPTEVLAIDFMSKEPPLNRTTLSIGLCTFNQEAYLARTLTRVAGLAKAIPEIRAVHVVNQGPPFQSAVIKELLSEPKINAVEQRNLGGCGGFTRSLIEEFAAAEPATHHLMMDDDIVLDERMILRSLTFLNYAVKELSIGAGMLDSLRPTMSHEIGAYLWPDLSFTSYCRDVDLADAGHLWHFNVPVKTDYNAWWFCILPVERSRKLALPAPIFIRGDDLEYGTRLARDGVPTVTLPGIGVWHEPFHSKTSYWSDYYNLRNRLIFASIYSDYYQQLPLTTVMGFITSAILTHNYQSAEEQMKSVRDFLLGPEKLFAKDTEEVHKEVMAIVKRDIPEKMDAGWKLKPVSPGTPRPASLRAKITDSLKAMILTGFGRLDLGGNEILMDVFAHPGNTGGKRYILTNGLRSYNLRFTPNRRRMWTLMMKATVLAWRYRSQKAKVGADWARHIATYRDPAWWATYFAIPGSAAKPVAFAPATPTAEPPAFTSQPAAVASPPEKIKEKA